MAMAKQEASIAMTVSMERTFLNRFFMILTSFQSSCLVRSSGFVFCPFRKSRYIKVTFRDFRRFQNTSKWVHESMENDSIKKSGMQGF